LRTASSKSGTTDRGKTRGEDCAIGKTATGKADTSGQPKIRNVRQDIAGAMGETGFVGISIGNESNTNSKKQLDSPDEGVSQKDRPRYIFTTRWSKGIRRECLAFTPTLKTVSLESSNLLKV